MTTNQNDINLQYDFFKVDPALILGNYFETYLDEIRTEYKFHPEQYQASRREFIAKLKKTIDDEKKEEC